MSPDVTIPRETARERAEALREHAKQCPPMSSMAADLRAAADVLDPPAPPLTLAQEATVERFEAEGWYRHRVLPKILSGEWTDTIETVTAVLDLAARDPLRLLAEHGTPLTEEPPEGTLLLVVPRGGGTPWVAWMGFSSWVYLNANGTVYRLGGAS